MGCPIRKFPDQSLFAAPRNLSQRTTSFIASQRQGIRRIPFRHLIVLEIRKRTTPSQPSRVRLELRGPPRQTRLNPLPDRKDQFCFKHIREPAVRRGSRLVCYQTTDRQFSIELAPNAASSVSSPKPDALPLHDVMERTTPRRICIHARRSFEDRWRRRALRLSRRCRDLQILFSSEAPLSQSSPTNRTHPPPPRPRRANLGGARRDRTDDLMLAKHALSQLSYGPERLSCASNPR